MTPHRTPDAALARKVWDVVLEEHLRPSGGDNNTRWVQTCWRGVADRQLYHSLVFVQHLPAAEAVGRCGTTMCVAGWAVELSPDAEWASDDPMDDEFDSVRLDDRVIHANQAARQLLGISESRAAALFDAGNSIYNVHRVLSIVAGEELTPLPPQPPELT